MGRILVLPLALLPSTPRAAQSCSRNDCNWDSSEGCWTGIAESRGKHVAAGEPSLRWKPHHRRRGSRRAMSHTNRIRPPMF